MDRTAWTVTRTACVYPSFCLCVQVKLAADPTGGFIRLLGLELGITEGQGPKCQRFAGIMEDGILLKVVSAATHAPMRTIHTIVFWHIQGIFVGVSSAATARVRNECRARACTGRKGTCTGTEILNPAHMCVCVYMSVVCASRRKWRTLPRISRKPTPRACVTCGRTCTDTWIRSNGQQHTYDATCD